MLLHEKKYPGEFIVAEGIDGAGKTTAIGLLYDMIKAAHPVREVIKVRLPDGPIRDILLQRGDKTVRPAAELMLYVASHAYMLDNVIIPALERGAIVVCDRFIHSTLAYQGFGRRLLEDVNTLIAMIDPPEIDRLIFIQADLDITTERLTTRGAQDFMDSEQLDFKKRTRNGMLTLMEFAEKQYGMRFSRVNNTGTLEELSDILQSWVKYHYPTVSVEDVSLTAVSAK